MYVVTGGAGFIGSNIVSALNERGISDILVVDDLSSGEKFSNIADLDIADYMDKCEFLSAFQQDHGIAGDIAAVFHQGACSSTTEWDGRYMMENNYSYSKHLLHFCLDNSVPFIYASSAAVYGGRSCDFIEEKSYERPLNVYGYSKLQFDNYVRRVLDKARSQIVGLRYFNVYGPREKHKASMASVAFHLNKQMKEDATLRLFEGSDGYCNGGQRRDFVYVEDVCKVNLWFLDHPEKSGIYNVGTGHSEPFQAVAEAVIAFHQKGVIDYIPFPEQLKGRYQSFTEANLKKLRDCGYAARFMSVSEGVEKYMQWLNREMS